MSRSPRRIRGKRPAASLSLRTLVINLDRRKDRWSGLCARLREVKLLEPGEVELKIERLPATDGVSEEVPVSAVGLSWDTTRNAKYDGRSGYCGGVELRMTPGERGCAMSHVRAWRLVAAASRPVLILEDDAVLGKSFAKRLKVKLREAEALEAEALYLGHINGAPWRQKKRPGLYEAEYLWTTVAYVLWPHGAQKLLELLPVDEPVDNFLGWQMAERRLFALAVVPELVTQDGAGRSRKNSGR
ncbi:unnamed protein product [Effrenium voratum]|uniref:Glycosyl transferase family 25 domain-containing protein n=1 Tax=Effrenium voratum TaxID=2562239 RepID=A0AA36J823_9DINO|nr:unnamed protein product [Effrenium voratum]